MAEIPDYETLMLPVLKAAAEGETTIPKVVDQIGKDFQLTSEQMVQPLPSGGIAVVNNRAHWAKTYLAKAGLIEQPRRGVFKISERGSQVLNAKPTRIDIRFLEKYPEFVMFRHKTKNGNGNEHPGIHAVSPGAVAVLPEPPNERIAAAAKELETQLRDDLLNRIFQIEPVSVRANFFERLVIRLLIAMGYGRGREEAALQLGGKGDGGVDGVIHEDALGIDPVYVQAKCYDRDSLIGPGQIQAFKGALDDKGATRGVFITTAKFSSAAKNSGRASQKQIALIDGEQLVELMVRFNVGVQSQQTITIKKIDEDFFEE